jgi:UDP-N-acetylmuramoylalanine--D-glutamate ligase
MNKEYIKSLYNRKILILGFGLEGRSTLKFIQNNAPSAIITIADKNNELEENTLIKDGAVGFISGDEYLSKISDYDLVIKTPGISLKDIEIKDKTKIISQSQIFINIFNDKIIGITGTKGKSTTSSLVYHIISKFTDNVILVGNIGVPPLDLFDKINDDTIIVNELSSHQLEFNTVSPHIAVLLNIFEEHLDHYNSYFDYKLAKLNIARYQQKDDYFIYNADDLMTANMVEMVKPDSKLFPYSEQQDLVDGCMLHNDIISFVDCHEEKFSLNTKAKRKLPGHHNLFNIMAAVCACKLAGIPDEFIHEGIATFKPLEHRIEYVGKYNNTIFYNDSIATIPEATIEAVKTLKIVGTLILGGFDREINYNGLMEYLASTSIKNLIFMGEAGKRMHSIIKAKTTNNNQSLFVVSGLEDAVYTAIKKTPRDMICLLSPAAASYDMFKNFEERGKKFKQLVKEL